ncbi:uncharacterized protein [Littorina saxatilis]|uniref:Transmembrane protein n=1 Tax=Littorina saxatilis TaxID=31220 RepID=A0AAN9C1Y4_9CAEN
MITRELSRSSDSSRTNSREILEVVMHKKGEEDDRHQHHHNHHHQPQHQQSLLHHQHPLQQLHQHRSADSSSRLSAMLVRTTHLHNHLGELSRGPSSFSRKSLSRQSLDSTSPSEPCHPTDHHNYTTTCICGGGVGAFLNSLGLLAGASLILGAMSLLLLASLAQEHADIRTASGLRGNSNGASVQENGASVPDKGASVLSDVRKSTGVEYEKSYSLSETTQDSSFSKSKRSIAHDKIANFQTDILFRSLQSDGKPAESSAQGQSAEPLTQNDDSAEESKSLETLPSLLEGAVAMATLVLVADLCCLMVCCMQCFFGSKLLTLREGEERSSKYLRECSSSRFIAVTGFFLSIPAFLVALVLVVVVKLHPGPALTSSVVIGVGGLFCILSVMQNLYHWRVEKTRADEGRSAFGGHMLLHPRPHLPPSPCRVHPPTEHSHHAASNPGPAATTQGELTPSQKNELSTLV